MWNYVRRSILALVLGIGVLGFGTKDWPRVRAVEVSHVVADLANPVGPHIPIRV